MPNPGIEPRSLRVAGSDDDDDGGNDKDNSDDDTLFNILNLINLSGHLWNTISYTPNQKKQ